jgi:quinoprotein glucose dehydrogenase
VVSKIGGPLATLSRAQAGSNWAGGSYDPETHRAYLVSTGTIGAYGLVPPADAAMSDMEYVQGSATAGARRSGGAGSAAGGGRTGEAAGGEGGGGGALSVRGLPLGKPPYERLTAIDLDRGDILWQIAHGETPDNVRNHPALKGLNIPRTGQSGYVGVLVTKTLVIAADPQVTATADHPRGAMLRAYNKATGKELGAVWMPAPQSGSPMTYSVDGRQYIIIAISGGNYSGEYLAFALPQNETRQTQQGQQ